MPDRRQPPDRTTRGNPISKHISVRSVHQVAGEPVLLQHHRDGRLGRMGGSSRLGSSRTMSGPTRTRQNAKGRRGSGTDDAGHHSESGSASSHSHLPSFPPRTPRLRVPVSSAWFRRIAAAPLRIGVGGFGSLWRESRYLDSYPEVGAARRTCSNVCGRNQRNVSKKTASFDTLWRPVATGNRSQFCREGREAASERRRI